MKPHIQSFDGVVKQETLKKVSDEAFKCQYTTKWKSDKNLTYDTGHWNHIITARKKGHKISSDFDLSESENLKKSPLYDLWRELNIKLGKRQLVRAYYNLYTFGTEGYIHTDDMETQITVSNSDTNMMQETTMLYLNPGWDPDWAGETIIFNKEKKEVLYATLPVYGRVLRFDGSFPHVGRSISRICPEVRVIVAFKTMKDVVDEAKATESFQVLSNGVPHSHTTFWDHCYGTYSYLKQMNLEENVCLAGMYHSIYGTQSFKSPIVIERDTVKKLIGTYAENLAYKFCTMQNRSITILENRENLSPIEHCHLMCIEYANLIEQAPRLPSINRDIIYRLKIAIDKCLKLE